MAFPGGRRVEADLYCPRDQGTLMRPPGPVSSDPTSCYEASS